MTNPVIAELRFEGQLSTEFSNALSSAIMANLTVELKDELDKIIFNETETDALYSELSNELYFDLSDI